MRNPKLCEKIHRHSFLQLLVCHFRKWLVNTRTCVIHEDVELAHGAFCCGNKGFHLGLLGEVAGEHMHPLAKLRRQRSKLGGVDFNMVPYNAMPQGIQDTLAGRVQLIILAIPSAASFMKDKMLTPIAISTSVSVVARIAPKSMN